MELLAAALSHEFARTLGMKPICDKAVIAIAAIPILTRTNSLLDPLD